MIKTFFNNIETWLASFFLVLFSSLTVLQILTRFIFNVSLTWSEEISRYAFIWFVYLSASYAVKNRTHVRFQFLVDAVPTKLQNVLKFLALLCWLSFLVFLLIYSSKITIQLFNTMQLSPANRIPMYMIYLVLPIGSFLMTIRVIQHIVDFWRKTVRRSAEE
ncbi:TRAP transporter small permease subunit [Paenibacillus sp. LMG 31456]|uniref:TRAP transporter small permease subunit n=1 Tax=Paenibacillus foliorum TaxID=2654974 RepID=A0A972K3H8_9BACL|nr:TRAP transporter small permease [Paenibacillus foliorum]NOU97836.1 TRAP transporter small permease subunit [Paenibacillus foliorum]